MDGNDKKCTVVRRRKRDKLIKLKSYNYVQISNAYATLPQFSAPPTPHDEPQTKVAPPNLNPNNQNPVHDTKPHESHYRQKVAQRQEAQAKQAFHKLCENEFLDKAITTAEYERTKMAKSNNKVTIDGTHHPSARRKIKILQQGKNVGRALSTTFKCAAAMFMSRKVVRFANKPTIATFHDEEEAIMLTYDSGADGNYLSEEDRKKAGLPILRRSTKSVGVANAGTIRGKW